MGLDAQGISSQGISVALSGDGSVLAVGGYNDNGGVGATWMFEKSDTGDWEPAGSKIVGSGFESDPCQGFSVAFCFSRVGVAEHCLLQWWRCQHPRR